MTFKLATVLAFGVLASGAAQAQFAKPEDAVKYRQSAFALMGNHMGRINAQLKSDAPNLQVIQSSTALVETMAKLPFEAFVPGSESIANTKAKPEVFKDSTKIKTLVEKMQTEVAKLSVTAKAGDVKAIRAQFGEVAQSCDACHDDYRKK